MSEVQKDPEDFSAEIGVFLIKYLINFPAIWGKIQIIYVINCLNILYGAADNFQPWEQVLEHRREDSTWARVFD